MDKTTLVERDFKDGEIVIKELEKAHFNVHSALWLYNTEQEYWRLIIASDIVDTSGPKKAYSQINEVLNTIENFQKELAFSLENISAISPDHPLIKMLSIAINTGPNDISGIRFSHNTINNNYIEDAYIYRIQ